jgi:hypothetical protein
MTDETTTPKRGRPAAAEQSSKNRRNEIALTVLAAALNNREVTNTYELVRYCFAVADVFIEVADE